MGGLGTAVVGGGYTNPIATPVLDENFVQNLLYGPPLTVVRNAVGQIDDLSGVWSSVAANTLRRSNKGAMFEGVTTNLSMNSEGVGAAAGSPGTAPTGWNVNTTVAGLTRTISTPGQVSGIGVTDFRWAGTSTGAGPISIGFEPSATISAAPGDRVVGSVFLALPAGSLANITGLDLRLQWQDSGGATLSETAGSGPVLGLTSTLTRYMVTGVAPASTAFVTVRVRIGFTSGAALDFTIRAGGIQPEKVAAGVSTPSSYTKTLTVGQATTSPADVVTATLTSAISSATIAGVFRQNQPTLGGTILQVGTSTNGILLRCGTADATRLEAVAIVGGTAQASAITATGALSAGTRFAAAASYASGRIALSLNGGTIITSAPASMPSGLTALTVGGGSASFNGYEERTALLPAAMVDTEVVRLGTLASWGG